MEGLTWRNLDCDVGEYVGRMCGIYWWMNGNMILGLGNFYDLW